jgi:methylated-DNA-[protein]-cysteine S-methyltransferase
MTVSPDLDRFREAAAAEHLLDVGFDVIDSPIGPLLVAATDRGSPASSSTPSPSITSSGSPRRSGRACPLRPTVNSAHRQLDEYFEGTRSAFALEVDLAARLRSHSRCWTSCPRSAGTRRPTARSRNGAPRARAVGTVMNRNLIPIVLLCHQHRLERQPDRIRRRPRREGALAPAGRRSPLAARRRKNSLLLASTRWARPRGGGLCPNTIVDAEKPKGMGSRHETVAGRARQHHPLRQATSL